jgi:hypothetical protein
MNFSGSTQFDVGAAAFLGVDASIGGSIGVLCAGGSLHAGINFYGVGFLNLTNKTWGVEGGSDLILSGKIYGASGLCDSECEGLGCIKKSVSGSFKYGVMSFKLGTDGVKLSL